MPIDDAANPSSRNAVTHGLFAARFFVRPGEEEEYEETLASVIAELDPEGPIEEAFAAEIVGAAWRLHRCRTVEQSLGSALDPMVGDEEEKKQVSVDRARAQAHNILRRSLTELRRLKAERDALQTEASGIAEAFLKEIDPEIPDDSFCKSPKPTPRNARCPCGSRAKFKRCCGKGAPPVLNLAA
ncbi:MAG: SEC-C metal-binding domain-containing protein [Bryobacteraceae bacterium]|jgi:hypothetical protein